MSEPLEAGTVVRSALATQSIWVKTNLGWVWIDRYTGTMRGSNGVAMNDTEAMTGPEFWVQSWDGRTIKQWDRAGGGTVDESPDQLADVD